MDKLTKQILVAVYVLQVGVMCREQLIHAYERVAEQLVPHKTPVHQVVQNVVLKEAQDARGPTSEVAIAPADFPLFHLPTVIAAVAEAKHPLHPHDDRHDKDRVKRHRRLHKFVGPLRYYENLAMSIAAIKAPAGTELAFVTAPIRLNLYGQA